MTTVSSLNGLYGTLTLAGFETTDPTPGTITISGTSSTTGSFTTTTLGTAVLSFEGASQGTVAIRSGAVTLTAGDVSYAQASGNIYNILDFGAKSGPSNDSSLALATAISHANANGGIVYIPSGNYFLSGPVAPLLSSFNSVAIIGDSVDTTTLTSQHPGILLTLNDVASNTGSTAASATVSIRNLAFSTSDTSTLSTAAMSIQMYGANSGYSGSPYISLLIEDVRIWGVGSSNSTLTPAQQAFEVGLYLSGGVNVRINRLSFAGYFPPTANPPNPFIGNGIELTSTVNVDIDSCYMNNANIGVALLDGNCSNISIRNSTFSGVGHCFANIAAMAYNSIIAIPIASSATSTSTVVTLSSLGKNVLDPYTNPPALGIGMVVVAGLPSNTLSIVGLNGLSNTITLSGAIGENLTPPATLSFQYSGMPLSGNRTLSLMNNEISTAASIMQLGLWSGVRLLNNDFTRQYGVGSTMAAPIYQLDYVDVSNCIAVGNNFLNGKSNSQSGSIGDYCFKLQVGSTSPSGYTIVGNSISSGYAFIVSAQNTVSDLRFTNNDTGGSTAAQFADGNAANFIFIASSSGTLTSYHPFAISGNGNISLSSAQTLTLSGANGITLPGLPTSSPPVGSGKLWNDGGVVHIA